MGKRPEQSNKPQVTYVNGLGFIPETPKQAEQKRLIMQYNVLLFSILLLFFLRMVMYEPIVNLLSFAGLNITINPLTSLVTMSEAAAQTANILYLLVYMGIPVISIVLYNRRLFRVRGFFKQPNPHTTRYGVIILTSVSVVAYFISSFFVSIMRSGGILVSPPAEAPPTEITAFILYFLSATLLPAFLEELLFRGAILHALRPFGDIVAVIVSTALYILVQPSLNMMVYAAVIGMALGYFTVKSGSVWTAVAGSFTVKGLDILRSLMQYHISADLGSRFFYLSALVLLLLGAVAFILFVRRDRQAFQLYDADTLLTNRTKVKFFFSNLGLWMVVVLAFLYVVRYIQIIG